MLGASEGRHGGRRPNPSLMSPVWKNGWTLRCAVEHPTWGKHFVKRGGEVLGWLENNDGGARIVARTKGPLTMRLTHIHLLAFSKRTACCLS